MSHLYENDKRHTYEHELEKRLLVDWSLGRISLEQCRELNMTVLDLDWHWLIQAALIHGIGPLICYYIEQQPEIWQLLNAEIRHELMQIEMAAHVRHRRCVEEVSAILRSLNERNVPAVVLKGPVLSSLYPEDHLRWFTDLDLLVHERDLELTEEALGNVGYYSEAPIAQSKPPENFTWHLPAYIKTKGSPIAVEVHGNQHAQFGHFGLVDLAEWLENAVPTTLYGIPTFTLTREDALFFLLDHIARHHSVPDGRNLKSLLDACLHIKAGVDWNKLLTNVHRFNNAEKDLVVWVEQTFYPLASDPQAIELQWLQFNGIANRVHYAMRCLNEIYGLVVPDFAINGTYSNVDYQQLCSLGVCNGEYGGKQRRYQWHVPYWNRVLDYPDVSSSIPDLLDSQVLELWMEYDPLPPLWENSQRALDYWRRAPRIRPK